MTETNTDLTTDEKLALLLELQAFESHPQRGHETEEEAARYNELVTRLQGCFPEDAPCRRKRNMDSELILAQKLREATARRIAAIDSYQQVNGCQ